MVDRYYRKIESVKDNNDNSLEISGMLLNILYNLTKIDANETAISSNLTKIEENETNISSNLEKIGTNETNTSSNLGKINNHDDLIAKAKRSGDLAIYYLNKEKPKISKNETNISCNLEKVNTKETNISSNSEKIETNAANISSNLEKISDIQNGNKYSIENFFIYNIRVENNYISNKYNPKFSIFNYDLNYQFKKDNILEINCRLLYQYTNYNNIGFLLHNFKLYDGVGAIFYEYKSLITNSGDNRLNDIKQSDIFYVRLDEDYGAIKFELILSLLDNVSTTITCKLCNTYNSNFLRIKHINKKKNCYRLIFLKIMKY